MRVLLACDTSEFNPWARDRLVAINKALGEASSEYKIVDIYGYKGLEKARKIHKKRAINHFNRFNIPVANESLLQTVLDFNPDLCVLGTVDNYALYLFPETILKIREKGIRVVGILGDDEFTWKRNQYFVPYFDKVMVYVSAYAEFYNQLIDDVSFYLPNSCYLANKERPRIKERQKKYDVTLVGAPFGPRPEIVRLLDEAGVDICVFGSRAWLGKLRDPKVYKGYIAHNGFDEVCLYSKIILAPLEDHLSGQMHMNTKIWEAVRAGQLPITSYYKPLFDDYGLIEGESIVTYRDLNDLVKKVKFYLDHPDERERIADALYSKVYSQFNYDTLYEKFFLKMEEYLNHDSIPKAAPQNVLFLEYQKLCYLKQKRGKDLEDFIKSLADNYVLVINSKGKSRYTEEAIRIATNSFPPTTSTLLYQSVLDEMLSDMKIHSIFKVLFTKSDFIDYLRSEEKAKARVNLGKPIRPGFGRLFLLGVMPLSAWDYLFDFWNAVLFMLGVGKKRVLKFFLK